MNDLMIKYMENTNAILDEVIESISSLRKLAEIDNQEKEMLRKEIDLIKEKLNKL